MSELPKDWTTVALGDVAPVAEPGFAYGGNDQDGVFQFRMNNIRLDGTLDLQKQRRVPPTAHKKFERFYLDPGDILFNATNGPDLVGKTLLVRDLPEPAVFSNHFLRIRTDPSAVLATWMQWQFRRGFFRTLTRQWVNQASIKREQLMGLIGVQVGRCPSRPPPMSSIRSR